MTEEVLTATDALDRIARGDLPAADAFEHFVAVIAREEPRIQAFAHLDIEGARASLPAAATLPLAGLPVAVKDIIDTADTPTCYGSPIFAGHRPAADAAIVTRLKALGATIVGKSVTTEFAYYYPGPTRNPRNTEHTPGGSSSGSAAAVAAGMVPFSIGSQTAGSMLRPASFCGVVGLKPSFGLLPLDGVHPLSASLDTLGLFATTVADMALFFALLAPDAAPAGDLPATPRIGVLGGYHDDAMSPEARAALDQAVADLRAGGVDVVERPLDPALAELDARQQLIMKVEMARALAHVRRDHSPRLSPVLAAFTEEGAAVPDAEYETARAVLVACRAKAAEFFAGVDLLLTIAAPGPAPHGIGATGLPIFNRLWTALGTPALSLPAPVAGLPIGLQLIAPPAADRALLAHTATLAPIVRSPAAG